ncbi:uncharacterized protein LOC135350513 isoform X3 [Halichondria panicea]|uniref:uncharacterized protein LOC135350513 isoform X3 n=1 Tax=Halichondria panicea TaxID=6063 RepID=UPI00312B7FEA
MAERQDREQEYIFRNVQLFKNDTLGTGSYGAVCKAKCDQLLCAAKLLYPVLFQIAVPDPGKEHRHPFRRFETECAFLSRINHPNIVQYLGTYRDPDTNAPVLLMELMDESLTHFLESSPGDIPYHIQVNLSYDIAQALAFLHSNGIIHRDLSSNNVLLIAGTRAKVTDFGMSKFRDINVSRLATMTTCPGTPAFMSPEALNEPPVYTEKLDNFSFGVLLVQTTTRQFPKPTDRFESVQIPAPRNPSRIVEAKVAIPELERRQAHMILIEPTHPLLPIARHCLKDRDVERPSSQQLCQTLDALKRTPRYQESSQQDLHQMLREKDEQLQANQQIITEKDTQLQANRETIIQNNEQLHTKDIENGQLATELAQEKQGNQTLQHEAEARERQLRRLNQELQSREENTAALQQAIDQRDREVTQLRQTLASKNEESHDLSTRMHQVALQDEQATPMKPVTIESLPDALDGIGYGSSAVIGDKAYFNSYGSKTVYEFSNNQWHKLPPCPNNRFTIVSVDDMLTTVGGYSDTQYYSDKLYSYINNKLVEHFPPIPTERWTPGAVYANNTLVVAGGFRDSNLNTVEILNTANMRWSIVSSLPVSTTQPSTTICGDYVYIHPQTDNGQEKYSVYRCSLRQLTQSPPSSAIWEKIAPLPVSYSSLVTIKGHLLAVGGRDSYKGWFSNGNKTKNIYQYNETSWTVISQMSTPRSRCLTAALPWNKLMVRDGGGASQAVKKVKSVMGTDGDLRKLKLSKAKNLLRNFGVAEEEIDKMSRWQVVDRVRELSTKAVKSGGEGLDMKSLKFARGARFSQMEAQERYREECQRIFDLQNEVLRSNDVLSTDEESSGGESDDELGRDLETLLRGSKTTSQLTREQEEAERLELKKLIMGDKKDPASERGTPIVADLDDTSSVMSFSSGNGRRLIISRTFRDEDGAEYVRDEVVKRQDVIDAYVRLSNDMRSKFIDQDEQTREDMRKEKRKIQDELRRLNNMKKRKKKQPKPKPLTTINMKCSACGQRGHMKTNRNCPAFNRSVAVAPTDQELEQHEAELSSQSDIVKVEGTKVILNRAVVERVAEFRRKSLLLKFPKDAMRKRRRGPQDEDLDYLETRKSVQRRKTSPEVPFVDHLEKILQTLIAIPESYHFRKPVQPKIVPDYYNVIKFPMDLQTMRDHCRHHVYKSRDAFKEHINLIVTNCVTYNGSTSDVTKHAHKMAAACEQELKTLEKELEQLEAEINPVLDDNAVVALCYLLSKSVDVMKSVDQTWPFHHPVSAKKIPDYHKIIKSPMDLQTMKKNCSGRVYTAVDQFVMDLNQVVENSITYNGPSSAFTQTAKTMREAGLKYLEENVEMISTFEDRIQESEMVSGGGEDELLYQDLQHSDSDSDSHSEDEEEVDNVQL